MRLLKLIPDNTNIGFVRIRYIAFAVTMLLTIFAIGLVAIRGLNMGVDFAGGVSIEEKFVTAPPLDQVRTQLEEMLRQQTLADYQKELREKAKIQ